MALTYVVRFGDDSRIELKLHRFKTGYRASESKFRRHIHVNTEAELVGPHERARTCSALASSPAPTPTLISSTKNRNPDHLAWLAGVV